MSRGTGGLFLSAVLLAFLLSPPAAKADTFVINDLTETPTISGLGASPVACTAPPFFFDEDCSFQISPPAGATSVHASSSVFPANATSFGGLIADPDGTTISDEITVFGTTEPFGVSVHFISDISGESSFGLCFVAPGIGGCGLIENGEVQTAGTITWLDSAGATVRTDTIEFVSDTDAVPEPASWLLVLTGLPLLGRRRLRRPPVGS
jgi:hypothetical protein